MNFITSLDEMTSLPTDLQFKLLSKRLPEAVVMAKVYLIIKAACIWVMLMIINFFLSASKLGTRKMGTERPKVPVKETVTDYSLISNLFKGLGFQCKRS